MKINLASTSPRRQQLLQQIDVDFELVKVNINETWDQQESPPDYVSRLALEKARSAKSQIKNNWPVLAADTCVVVDGLILGKPENRQQASDMLRQLAGKTHTVHTAVAVITDIEITRLNTSRISFGTLSEDDILQYCQTDEPLGKAGGYAVQGRAAGFIKHLEGSYSGVMGLPLFEVAEILKEISGNTATNKP